MYYKNTTWVSTMPGLRIHREETKREREGDGEGERERERNCKIPVWIQYFLICALHAQSKKPHVVVAS